MYLYRIIIVRIIFIILREKENNQKRDRKKRLTEVVMVFWVKIKLLTDKENRELYQNRRKWELKHQLERELFILITLSILENPLKRKLREGES